MRSATKICPWCGWEQPYFSGRWCEDCEKAHGDEYRAIVAEAAPEPPEEPQTEDTPPSEPPGPNWRANQRRYRDRKAKGQCQRCNEPARPGRVFCESYARKKSEWEKAKRARS